jgi:hypothetical protein
MSKFLLGHGDVGFSILDLCVFTKVWNKVVSWRITSWSRSVILVIELLLSSGNVGFGILDFVIFTKMWNEVITLWLIRCVEGGLQNMSKILFGLTHILEGSLDFKVFAKVWNKIVDFVVLWVLPLWLGSVTAPWDRSCIRSILDGSSFACK